MKKTLLITGGSGFIGSAAVLNALDRGCFNVVNVDKLTYSGNPASLLAVEDHPSYRFFKADIADPEAMRSIFSETKPDYIMNLAAESHVDRSIDGPGTFIDTNIKGTYTLLESAREYWKGLQKTNVDKAQGFRFLHISTDEVFGDLKDSGDDSAFFNEETAYSPSSPYSASKAASDHLVKAWKRTYGLPALITNCSNNYGPRQFPEKLIPLTIINALSGKPLPVYGKGQQIRDWLHVEDHVSGLFLALQNGEPGAAYCIGGHNERKNIEVVEAVCACLEELRPVKPKGTAKYSDLITFVADRPGHDGRYAIDSSKIQNELGWKPAENFESGLKKTVQWYLKNEGWWRPILEGKYQGQRLGVKI